MAHFERGACEKDASFNCDVCKAVPVSLSGDLVVSKPVAAVQC